MPAGSYDSPKVFSHVDSFINEVWHDILNLEAYKAFQHPHSGYPGRIWSGARAAFVKPILERKGWSILDWAIESRVDFHTASDYLKGKTKPYPSTRKKLADALGVPVRDLPK